MMFTLAVAGSGLPSSFVLVYVVGFIAAISIGSIAWYNSTRPPGWENKDKPGFLPKVNANENDAD
jgi:hypothetical protein